MPAINIFYSEPNPDRWIKYDRYPRQLIRCLIRGKHKPGGQMMVALELMKGLDKLKIPYRFNDYNYAKKHPHELIGVIGKSHLIFEKKFKNPILFGASVFSHAIDSPDLLQKYSNIKEVLVPGEWMRKMFEPYYGSKVKAWPVGINTDKWSPKIKEEIKYDFLIYNKIRWQKTYFKEQLVEPIEQTLTKNNLTFTSIVYGEYKHEDLLEKLAKSKAVIFLCEHETQGLAYQQILATNTPILAYDQQDFWLDPYYYPEKVKFGPVSSVPYWDNRCGVKFKKIEEFEVKLLEFVFKKNDNQLKPLDYILENLTLEKCAQEYYQIYTSLANTLHK
jgi:hypothetical protein